MVLVKEDGKHTTKSYPKYLMEQTLNRDLTLEETVDHIDEDFTNDKLDNLQILSREENAAKSMSFRPRKTYSFVCPECNKEATKYLNQVKSNLKKTKRGPFCSKVCAGRATYVNPWKEVPKQLTNTKV